MWCGWAHAWLSRAAVSDALSLAWEQHQAHALSSSFSSLLLQQQQQQAVTDHLSSSLSSLGSLRTPTPRPCPYFQRAPGTKLAQPMRIPAPSSSQPFSSQPTFYEEASTQEMVAWLLTQVVQFQRLLRAQQQMLASTLTASLPTQPSARPLLSSQPRPARLLPPLPQQQSQQQHPNTTTPNTNSPSCTPCLSHHSCPHRSPPPAKASALKCCCRD